MSYTPTTWTSGDIVTSAKLNKIENGIVEASSSGGCEVYEGVFTEIEVPDDDGDVQVNNSGGTRSSSSHYGFVFPITYGQAFQKMNEGTIIILKGTIQMDSTSSGSGIMILNSILAQNNGTNTFYSIKDSLNNNNDLFSYFILFSEGLADTYIGDYFDESILNPSNGGGDDSGSTVIK